MDQRSGCTYLLHQKMWSRHNYRSLHRRGWFCFGWELLRRAAFVRFEPFELTWGLSFHCFYLCLPMIRNFFQPLVVLMRYFYSYLHFPMITLQRLLCSQYLAIKQDVLSSVSAPERTNLDRRTIVATGSSAKSCVEPQTISGNSRAVSIKQKAARHLLAPSGAKPTPVPPRYTLVS